jgi:hypothetical protein
MSVTSPVLPDVVSTGSSVDSREEIEELLSVVEPTAATFPTPEAASAHGLDPATDHPVEPIAAVIDLINTSCADYDRLIDKLGLSPRGTGVPGCFFHWARSTPDGLRIMEVWRNRESFEIYLTERLAPGIADIGLPEPEIFFYDVHNYLTPSSFGRLDAERS